MLTLVLAMTLAADPVVAEPESAPVAEVAEAEAAPTPPVENQPEGFSRRRMNALLFASGSVLLGAGGALGAWFDRDGTIGRICAISVGAIGLGLFAAAVGGLITRLIHESQPQPSKPLEAGIAAVGAAVAQAMVALISGVVGMVAGGVIAGFATTPPGTQRGVVGIVGGGLTAVTATAVAIAVW